MKRFAILFAVFALVACWAAQASAALISGTRTTDAGGGLVATGSWTAAEGGILLTFEVDFNGSEWSYKYTFANRNGSVPLAQNVSHLILEVSENFTNDNISLDLDPDTFSPGDPSNPNLPADIFGVKIDGGALDATGSITFTSDRAPMWGDIYLKDGKFGTAGNQVDTTAWNTGFGTDAIPLDLPLDAASIAAGNASNWSNFADWIPVPDTTSTVIPEASSLVAWGICAAFGAFVAYRRRRAC